MPSTNLGLTYETHSEAVYTMKNFQVNNNLRISKLTKLIIKILTYFISSYRISTKLKISDADETKNGEEMIE
ncbi:hypothetical protein C1646_754991 [Rhizophagus diaphanus]|nr:hypothetical protein C1646_754991 [Rhizophagus diaphanus] [Rhizophagus sp. MUCL 43196]